MSMIETSAWMDEFSNNLLGEVRWEMRVSVWHDAWRYAEDYLGGTTVEREGADIVVQVRGLIPNFIEHGLGPSGIGSEGPFDMRANILKGRERRAIPLPNGIRMMTANGKPWIHPGFKRMAFLPKIQAKLAKLAETAASDVGHRDVSSEWTTASPSAAPRTYTSRTMAPATLVSTRGP